MDRTKKKYAQWMPFAATLILTVVTLIAYTLINEERTIFMYVQVSAAALVTAILPLISTITKKKFPPVINVLIMIHILLASNLGSAMDFYGKFDCWDLVMHGYFGFVAAVTLYLLLLRWNGNKLNRFGFFALIFLGTLGGAAIWEIFEFTCDTFLGSDAQRVQESLALGLSPIQDTMTDIIAALVGVLVFYVGIYIVNFCNKRAAKKILY